MEPTTRPHRPPGLSKLVRALLAAGAFITSGCIGSTLGVQYVPERAYYRLYRDFYDVDAKVVKHVHEELWGRYFFGSETRSVSVRELIDRELAGNPDYYVSDLSIHTDMSGTVMFTLIAGGMLLPKTTVDFDVVEVVPWARDADSIPGSGGRD